MKSRILSLILVLALLLCASSALAESLLSFSLLVDDSGKVEDKVMLPILEEQSGIHVDFNLLPYDAAKERLSVLLTSGDYPDAIGGWLLSDNDILQLGMGEGMFVPLEPYITDETPNIQKALSLPGVKTAFTLPDGHIYTIPYVIDTPQVAFMPWINTAWLAEVGKEMPATTEEFRDVLRAFKEKYPDCIPFSADPDNKNLGLFAGWFGVDAAAARNDAFAFYAMVDGKLQFNANQEGFKEFIKYFNSLYAEGLIDPEIFTQDLANWKAKGKQGLYGSSLAYGSGDYYDMVPGTNETPYRVLPVLKSEFCDAPVYHRGSYGSYLFRTQVAVTDKCADPGLVVKWFDNVFAEDNSMQIQNGLYGLKLEKLEDGSYRRLDETKLTEEERAKYDWGAMFTQSLPKFCPPGLVIAPVEGQPLPYDEKKTADAVYEPYLNEMIPQVWMQGEVADRAKVIATDLASYINQKMAEWISGQGDVEAEWDAYCAQLEALGLAELTKINEEAVAPALS